MKKISIIVLIMIMFYIVANMVWLKVVNNNIDEYLDKDNVSRVNNLGLIEPSVRHG